MDLLVKVVIIRLEASKSSERTNDMNNIFSNNLKKFRQQKNYTQEQVAEVLGVSSHTVSRWECNTTLPDVTKAHSSEPVPYLIYDSRKAVEGVDTFTEANATTTGNFIEHGPSIMDRILEK